MNHEKEIGDLGLAFACVVHNIEKDLDKVEDRFNKQKTQLNQDLDKIVHWFYKIDLLMKDMNTWLSAFGADDDAKNP